MKTFEIYTEKGQFTNLTVNADSELEAVKKAKEHFKNGILVFSNNKLSKRVKDQFWAKEIY